MVGSAVGSIFDINEYGGSFKDAIQKVFGHTPGYANVGLVGTGCAVVGLLVYL